MKHIVLVPDGMADEPVTQLSGKTPMEAAYKPCMDSLAKHSEIGTMKTVPDQMKPGSDIANLSVLGYNPAIYYSGRSPLEAASIGIDLKLTDVTLRCNLVTLSDENDYQDKTLLDYCAGDISTADAKVLIEYVQKNLGTEKFKFYSGVAYRHCLVWSDGVPSPGVLTPPHDIIGQKILTHVPTGKYTEELYNLMQKSYDLLNNHPLNQKRKALGLNPANSIWLWGEGTKPRLSSFYDLYGLKGSMISAVDLLKGIAICTDMHSVDVEGATGYIDTNFAGKCADAILELTNDKDFVYIHVEAPDECGHRGEVENKVKSIELIDKLILAPLFEYFNSSDYDFKILVCPDHPTPLNIKTHTSKPVPYLIYDSTKQLDSHIDSFTEKTAEGSGHYFEHGYQMMEYFTKTKL